MSKMMGGFAGKPMLPESPWEIVKFCACMLPFVMFTNKLLQGNIWGIRNEREGIVPWRQVLRSPTDTFVDGFVQDSLDKSGFVGDPDEPPPNNKKQQQQRR
jgi:hypothetical protein